MPDSSSLTLSDRGRLAKLGVKGSGAEAWLREQGVDVPPAIYDTRRLGDGGLIARLGMSDFFLEGGTDDGLTRLDAELDRKPPRVYRVERQDASFLLEGAQALEVLAQLCSFDFRAAPPGRVVLTRAGGVNCAVLPEAADSPRFRLWVDCTYAESLWEMLTQIGEDLDARR